MKKKLSYKVYLSALLLVLCLFMINSGFTDYKRIKKKQETLASLKEEEATLKKEKKSLATEVKNLEDDDYIVRYARDNYVFSKSGEEAVVLPDED